MVYIQVISDKVNICSAVWYYVHSETPLKYKTHSLDHLTLCLSLGNGGEVDDLLLFPLQYVYDFTLNFFYMLECEIARHLAHNTRCANVMNISNEKKGNLSHNLQSVR